MREFSNFLSRAQDEFRRRHASGTSRQEVAKSTLFRITQPPFEETINLLVSLFGRRMPLASSHGDAMVVAEQFVDSNRMIERRPALRQISGAAGAERRSRAHQRAQFDQNEPAFN